MAHSHNSLSLLDISGLENVTNARVALVRTEWNDTIVSELKNGCKKILEAHQARIVNDIAVPGCFELPFACRQLWEAYKHSENAPEAIIAFGVVIRGGTPHFDYVCKAATDGILQLNLTLPVPVIFGVLTLDNEAQAWERLGGTHGHKGEEAAITALKMIKNSRHY